MILLREKVGGVPPAGALSMPKRRSDQSSAGRTSLSDPERIVILSGAKDLSFFVGVGKHANTTPTVRDIISLRNSKGRLA
jgi:hypothetical protein